MSAAMVPWDLKQYGKGRLKMLEPDKLRSMCRMRGITIGENADMVKLLLLWKKKPTAEPPGQAELPGHAEPPGPAEPPGQAEPELEEPAQAAQQQRPCRGANINVIALHNSRALAQVLPPWLADGIINERRINGDFSSFSDLEQRVRGVGPKTIEALKNARFRIEARKHGDADAPDDIEGVRLNVSSMGEQVWRHRSNIDLYTLLSKSAVVAQRPQVDHVWECQLIEDANAAAIAAAVGEGGPASRTRAVQSVVRGLFNGAENLNVTTCTVNQAKKGPITRWRNQRGSDGVTPKIDDLVRNEPSGRALVDDGHWERITSSIVKVFDELEGRKEQIRAARPREHADAILTQMHMMMEGMGLV